MECREGKKLQIHRVFLNKQSVEALNDKSESEAFELWHFGRQSSR